MKILIALVIGMVVLAGCVSNGTATPPLLNEDGTPIAEPTVATGSDDGRGGTEAMDFPQTSEEAFAQVYRSCEGAPGCLDLEVQEPHKCPGENNCWVIGPREKNMEAVILAYMGTNPTSCLQDGWLHNPADRQRYGRQEPASAKGSGVPAGFVGMIEGMTLRPCPITDETPQVTPEVSPEPSPTATVTPTQVVPAASPTATPTPAASTGFPMTKEDLGRVFSLDLTKVTISGCPSETGCWIVKPNVDFFNIDNPWDCWLDGYRAEVGELRPGGFDDPKVGIPPNFEGLAEAMTVRACSS